jgi:hypothetical protein
MQTKLINLCEMQAGITVGRHDFNPHGKTQIVQLKDIDAGNQLRSPLERVDFKRGIDRSALIQNNDILLKARGAKIVAARIQQAPTNAVASSAYFILRPFSAVVLPAFLAWLINNTRLPVLQSSVIQSINLKDLRETSVFLPPLAKQAEVVRAHALAEEARALFEQYHKKVNQQIRAFALGSAQKARAPEIRL